MGSDDIVLHKWSFKGLIGVMCIVIFEGKSSYEYSLIGKNEVSNTMFFLLL